MIFSQFGKPTLVHIEISSFGGLCHTVLYGAFGENRMQNVLRDGLYMRLNPSFFILAGLEYCFLFSPLFFSFRFN